MIVVEPEHDFGRLRDLILEYASSLRVDLSFQDFESEIASLQSFYVAAFVARDDELETNANAGCVALRKVDERTCEMKRLYVRPEYRGRGAGRSLALAAIDEARSRGFERMLLDTLPSMSSAQALYDSLGFIEIPPYRYNPVPGTRYYAIALHPK